MTPTELESYMLKARRSLASAELLLEDGDTEGACNRAYYAMFHAAHVALVALAAVPQSGFKTHRGLIAAFGQHVVTGANMDPELGRAIGQVQQVRQIADYTGGAPPLEDAEMAVGRAAHFVDAMRAFLPGPNNETARNS